MFAIFFHWLTGSIIFIFHPTGSFISGFLQEKYGRKYCMIFANIPSIFGWITLHFTHSMILLYTASVLMGLSIGFSEAPILSYVGEITEPRLRGSMTSLASAAVMFGSLIIFILGFLFEWRTVALLSSLCPIASMFLITLVMWLYYILVFDNVYLMILFIILFIDSRISHLVGFNRKK